MELIEVDHGEGVIEDRSAAGPYYSCIESLRRLDLACSGTGRSIGAAPIDLIIYESYRLCGGSAPNVNVHELEHLARATGEGSGD